MSGKMYRAAILKGKKKGPPPPSYFLKKQDAKHVFFNIWHFGLREEAKTCGPPSSIIMHAYIIIQQHSPLLIKKILGKSWNNLEDKAKREIRGKSKKKKFWKPDLDPKSGN